MTAPWKEFQDLVGRIEKIAATHDAVVRSPDRLFDIATGGDREVDATIRQRVGTTTVLITVECRRHSDTQDVTWIEQLATKRESVGAAVTIAVSSSGFSRQAAALAGRKGIVLRRLTELSDKDIEQFLVPFYHVTPCLEIVALGIALSDGVQLAGLSDLAAELQQLLDTAPNDAPVLRRPRANDRVSLNQVLLTALAPRGTRPFDQVPNDGTTVISRFEIEIPPGALQIETIGGIKEIERLVMDVKLHVKRELVPPEIAVKYSGIADPPDIHHAEYEVTDEGGGARLTLQYDEDLDAPAVQVQTRDRAGGFHPARLVFERSGRIEDGKFVESKVPIRGIRPVDP